MWIQVTARTEYFFSSFAPFLFLSCISFLSSLQYPRYTSFLVAFLSPLSSFISLSPPPPSLPLGQPRNSVGPTCVCLHLSRAPTLTPRMFLAGKEIPWLKRVKHPGNTVAHRGYTCFLYFRLFSTSVEIFRAFSIIIDRFKMISRVFNISRSF